MIACPSQCDRLLALLSDGRPRSVPEIHAAIGSCRLNSRASELRARLRREGADIVCERLPGVSGAAAYVYAIVASEACCNTADDASTGSAPAVGESAVSSAAPSVLRGDLERAGVEQLTLGVAA